MSKCDFGTCRREATHVVVDGQEVRPMCKQDAAFYAERGLLVRKAHAPDRLGNVVAKEGCDRCWCGCKYWEHDRCVDCGTPVWKVEQEVEG